MSSIIALPPWVGLSFDIIVWAAALLRGGPLERAAAIAMVVAWRATLIVQDQRWAEPQLNVLYVDTALMLVLLLIALRSDRYWPLWATAFQLLAVFSHCARLLDPTLGSWVYVTAGFIWTYAVVGALGVGTWGCWRERLFKQSKFQKGRIPFGEA